MYSTAEDVSRVSGAQDKLQCAEGSRRLSPSQPQPTGVGDYLHWQWKNRKPIG